MGTDNGSQTRTRRATTKGDQFSQVYTDTGGQPYGINQRIFTDSIYFYVSLATTVLFFVFGWFMFGEVIGNRYINIWAYALAYSIGGGIMVFWSTAQHIVYMSKNQTASPDHRRGLGGHLLVMWLVWLASMTFLLIYVLTKPGSACRGFDSCDPDQVGAPASSARVDAQVLWDQVVILVFILNGVLILVTGGFTAYYHHFYPEGRVRGVSVTVQPEGGVKGTMKEAFKDSWVHGFALFTGLLFFSFGIVAITETLNFRWINIWAFALTFWAGAGFAFLILGILVIQDQSLRSYPNKKHIRYIYALVFAFALVYIFCAVALLTYTNRVGSKCCGADDVDPTKVAIPDLLKVRELWQATTLIITLLCGFLVPIVTYRAVFVPFYALS